jgi:hypothetical protein
MTKHIENGPQPQGVQMTANHLDESQLRHPWEKPIFIASVLLNLAIMLTAIVLADLGADWVSSHPFIHSHIKVIRLLAIAAVLAPPAAVFIRNTRWASVLGNSVRLSPEQLPEIYSLLEKHCMKLGHVEIPELYLTDKAVSAPSYAFSTWKHHCIALSARLIERKPEKSHDLLSFLLARELGRLRLGHTNLWYEVLLAYMSRIPYLRNPLTQVQTLSQDRYGAYLEPNPMPGLLILASGRRLIDLVSLQEYLTNVRAYKGIWADLSDLIRQQPHVSYRVRALLNAGLLQIEPPALESQEPSGTEKHKNKHKHKNKNKDKDKQKHKRKQKVIVEEGAPLAAQ